MLKGRIVLVMGGDGNVGSSISQSLENHGAKVIRHGLKGEYAADVRNSDEIEKLISLLIDKFGHIDILINSVSAPLKIGSFEKKAWNDFMNHLEVQLKSVVVTTQLVLPGMKERKFGRIINILSSCVVGQPPSGLSEYTSAKYAVLGLTKSLAKELSKYQITVNAISPGFIKNDFSSAFPEKMIEIMASQNPLGRTTTTQDVANIATFLALPESGYITGENILVNGGELMR